VAFYIVIGLYCDRRKYSISSALPPTPTVRP